MHPRVPHPASPASRGFTLVELLVVLGIFSTVVVAASDIFILASRSERKTFGLERTQADARFTMEAITREIRAGRIDYAYYAGRGTALATPDAELALADGNGMKIRFFESDSTTASLCADAQSTPCLIVAVGSNAPVAITPKGVAVRNAKFYIAPAADPAKFDPTTGTYAANVQPRVTVTLVLQSTAERTSEQSVVYFQTTASSRVYQR